MLCFLKYYVITVIGTYYSTKLPWPLMLIAIVLMLSIDMGVLFCTIDGFFIDDIAKQKLKKNDWKEIK
jgi:hypothetical protein